MVFKCQEDSFLQEWEASVESCSQCTLDGSSAYQVVLSDTIFFPEGGGQPSDQGKVEDMEVLRIERSGDRVIHYLPGPLAEGSSVHLTIDWNRRFDHMQQHSGQHLLSAVLEREFGVATRSWWLGAAESYVEVSGLPKDMGSLLGPLEDRCNSLIREGRRVSVALKGPGEAEEAHTRGLPEDQRDGPLRVVTIANYDDNLCCGTHVSNLSQLQGIKVLGVEAGKKNCSNIRFLVGGRVLARLQLTLERERTLTGLLKGEGAQHPALVDKLQRTARTATSLWNEVARLEGELAMATLSPGQTALFLYRPRAPPDFLRSLSRALQSAPPSLLLLLATGDEDGGPGGNFLIRGPAEKVALLAPE